MRPDLPGGHLTIMRGQNSNSRGDSRALARALSAGEPRAILGFETQFRSLLIRALGCSRRQVSSAEDIERHLAQLCRHVFADGGRMFARYRGHVPFSHWLFGVAVRFFQSQVDHGARLAQLGTRLVPGEFSTSLEAPRANAGDLDALRSHVYHLDGFEQLYLRLRFVELLDSTPSASLMGHLSGRAADDFARMADRLCRLSSNADTLSPAVTGADHRLSRIPLQLPSVGHHPTVERFAGFFHHRHMTQAEARHIAGCDECTDLMLGLWSLQQPHEWGSHLNVSQRRRRSRRTSISGVLIAVILLAWTATALVL
ncbi:MAG: hypothetical protein VX589_20790 [Myxococcota bacterium]|nr:hypothetical protein [Myxococcota bacterium]